ncbi:MAG: LON peptidase substrate-binding domain-containing protein, partial [Spirochaetaceae bacterium]|nr:LON peptidase substrate-binding domain-containing protein [Spirochaetaceae bacterium]
MASSILSVLKGKNQSEEYPLLPLRDLVLFPNTMIPIFITYKTGIAAIEEALRRDYHLFAACRKNALDSFDTHSSGSVARIVQQLRLPDGTFRVVLHGEYRARITRGPGGKENVPLVKVRPIAVNGGEADDPEAAALLRTVQQSFARYAELSKKVSTDTLSAAEKADSPERAINFMCNALAVKPERKVELLSMENTQARLKVLLETLELENEIFGLQKKISAKVKNRMEKTQREYILNEQIREINKELGKESVEDEFAEMERTIAEKNPPEEVLAKARKEIGRLRRLQPFSPEAGVLRGYLEWITDLPWSTISDDAVDLGEAEKKLNE